jgi:hypothetical protein
MLPLVAVPFSRPELAAALVQTLAWQTLQCPVLVVANGAAKHCHGDLGFIADVLTSQPSAGAARNVAIEYARAHGTDWTIFLDDDDYYGPNYVAFCATVIASGDYDAFHQGMGLVRFADEGGDVVLFDSRSHEYACLQGNSLCVRTAVAPEFPPITFGEELPFTVELRARGARLGTVAPWHHIYNRHAGNAYVATRAQLTATYGSTGAARNLGHGPDSIADVPIDPRALPVEHPPSDEALFADLSRVYRAHRRLWGAP